MAYVSKHLSLASSMGGIVKKGVYVYDTADSVATVYASGYISDAVKRGMCVGDQVYVYRWNSAVPTTVALQNASGALLGITIHWVIGITSGGAADLTDGLAITATNT